jgi:hypothetical protein
MYHAVVRRVLAIALLGLFSFSLISPSVFASDPDAGLPACCRRAGKHRCSQMGSMATEGSASGPSLQSSRCSFFPGPMGVTASPNAGVLATPLVSRVAQASASANQQANETPSPVLFHSPRQQRGPPIFFLS